MAQDDYALEHMSRRLRLWPWCKRCSCGNELPCVVRAMLDRQRHFVGDAAPGWSPTWTATAAVPTVVPAAAAPAGQPAPRPLLTPGQLHRSDQRGRW